MKFFTSLWKKIMNIGCGWPKTIRIEVRNGDCQLLAVEYAKINSWNEIMQKGSAFAQEVMRLAENEKVDEVYWNYKEV